MNYHVEDSFHKVTPVWKDGWHEPYNTILPEEVVDYTLKGNRRFPDKRLIIHFMQPHFPSIDEEMRKIIGQHDGVLSRGLFFGKDARHRKKVWTLLQSGKIDIKLVWEAYNKNLSIVLEHVQDLLLELKGKTVISSDHANLFGEWLFPFPIKKYGHPGGIYKKSLIKVPWLIIESRERKTVVKDDSFKREPLAEKIDDEEIRDKLRALGYL